MTRLLAVCLILVAAPARAAVVRSVDLPELCRFADVVVHGVVIDARAAWEGKRIITRVTVRVDERLKGAPGATLVVKRLGGAVGGVAMSAAGEARLTPGDEVVLFLEWRGDGYVMLGMAQGVYRIEIDPGTGERLARQDLDGLALLGPSGKPSEPVARPPVRLADLLRDVRKNVP